LLKHEYIAEFPFLHAKLYLSILETYMNTLVPGESSKTSIQEKIKRDHFSKLRTESIIHGLNVPFIEFSLPQS
jgi:hypothetical protein